MASFGRNFTYASPVLAMPPQPAHHGSFGMAPFALQNSSTQDPTCADPGAAGAAGANVPPGSLKVAGRKRSRDEAGPNLVDETPALTPVELPKASEDEWEYGEGMVLVRRNQGYVADASSQSGTWLEENAARADVDRMAAAASAFVRLQERPILRSNKSQRLDDVLVPSPGVEPTADSLATAHQSAASSGTTFEPANQITGQPVIDDFTLHLGVGWRKVSDDNHIQAAARGWARYIENHYPLSSVNIRLESRGLQAYLVEAAEGFYLFAEDLKQGRLVSTQAEEAFQRLKQNPPLFASEQTLLPTVTPGSSSTEGHTIIQSPTRPDLEVEMNE